MASTTSPFRFVFLFSVIGLVSTSAPRLSLKLVPSNPIHALQIPEGRTDYLRVKANPSSSHPGYLGDKETPKTVNSRVIPFPGVSWFLANISIGEPPLSQLFLIDTGSDLTWLQCLPCKCYPQTIPFYSPSKSSSYRNASCESVPSAMPQVIYDSEAGICRYFLKYMDRTSTRGVLAEEKLTFQTTDEGLASVSDMVIGCGHENYDSYNLFSGVLGLGPGTFSIVKRFGSRFSYCFGALTDPSYLHNVLILGDGAILEGDPTRVEISDDQYFVNLEGISIGEKDLDIEPEIFKRNRYGSGTIIDTGCSVTILERITYENIVWEVNLLLDGVIERAEGYDTYTKPCFKGRVERDLLGFPVVRLRFEGGAELGLDAESLFVGNGSDEFCLALRMNLSDDRNVIGASAQQKYNVGFDLDDNKVYFQRIDCELLY
ncbi:PREDICTED: aspartyl protease UND-like [Tarenaya hassleriana]|uniref:aspartyl protease UND-like n=1 Tax=Tarenaya hassleriana TaxID=28532 RepID=UPI00053C2B11|nr:PREDICTED: aspartyl protease UND-like [Tarenaya hassleriana]